PAGVALLVARMLSHGYARARELRGGAAPETAARLPADVRPKARHARRGRGVPRRSRRAHADAGLRIAKSFRGDPRRAVQARLRRLRLVAEDEVAVGRRARAASWRACAEGAPRQGAPLPPGRDARGRSA